VGTKTSEIKQNIMVNTENAGGAAGGGAAGGGRSLDAPYRNMHNVGAELKTVREANERLAQASEQKAEQNRQLDTQLKASQAVCERQCVELATAQAESKKDKQDIKNKNGELQQHAANVAAMEAQLAEPKWKNSGIAMAYVPSWGRWEGFREFVQNALDAFTKANGGTRDGLTIAPELGADGKRNGTFSATTTKMDIREAHAVAGDGEASLVIPEFVRIGCIEFKDGKLSFINRGTISKKNLLLGGTDKPAESAETVGKFGEGLKLAIIALSRGPQDGADGDGGPWDKKTVTIFTAGEKWRFEFRPAEDYQDSEGQATSCLHYCFEPATADEAPVGQTLVDIGNVTFAEWDGAIDNFLDLTDADQGMVPAQDPDPALAERTLTEPGLGRTKNDIRTLITGTPGTPPAFRGDLLFGTRFKGKLFVKGIYICDLKGARFGYNAHCLELDRDRLCVPDTHQLWRTLAAITCSVMWQLASPAQFRVMCAEGGPLHNNAALREQVEQLPATIERMLHTHDPETHYTAYYVDIDSAEKMYMAWREKCDASSLTVPSHSACQRVAADGQFKAALCSQHVVYPMDGIAWRADNAFRRSASFCSPDSRLGQLRAAPEAEHSAALAKLAEEAVLPNLGRLGIKCAAADLRFVDAGRALGDDVRDISWVIDGKLCLSSSGVLGAVTAERMTAERRLECSNHMAAEICKLQGVSLLDIVAQAGIMGAPE
jgi:hypothetical protein